MQAYFNKKLLIILIIILISHNAEAQELEQFESYAGSDFTAYQSSQFSNPNWNDFVKEGFEAADKQDTQTCIEFLRKSINMGCGSPIVLFKLALCYEAQGSYYSAIQYYELAGSQFKQANQNHRYALEFEEHYGRALYLMGQISKAIPILEAASQKSTTPWVLKILADYYLNQGDYEKATSYYERLFSLENHGVGAQEQLNTYILLARAYKGMGNEEMTQRYYEFALQMDPKNQEASQHLREKTKNQQFEKVFEVLEKTF